MPRRERRIDFAPMSPGALIRLHESACRLRAYPRNAAELAEARRVLLGFHRLPGLRRHAEALADTGIVLAPIHYRFFWPTARWLVDRYPKLLTIDWRDEEFAGRLSAALPALVTKGESEALRRAELPAREAIDRLRPRHETDAVFIVRRLAALPGGDAVSESTHDAIDIAYRLEGSVTGPSRTRAFFDKAPFRFRSEPPSRVRPDLAAELRRPPRAVITMSREDGARLVALAREAMVTRSRDLDAFAHGDPRDVRLVDDGDGLAFALIGVPPESRLFLPAIYGALSLRNGVPIGYVQFDVLFGNAEVSYNTFETFRGGEAGFVFCRLLAACRHVFGVATFSIEPYQLGRGNEEGIASGAWWFYARFGFRPRDPEVSRLARAELHLRARDPKYRSGRKTLLRLAEAHVFWPENGKSRVAVTPQAAIGFALARRMSAASGSDREAAVRECERRVAARLGVRSLARWTAGERLWWRRWAPMLDAIAGIDRWTADERRRLVAVVRAKGGRRESDFAKLFDGHRRLAAGVLALPGSRRLMG